MIETVIYGCEVYRGFETQESTVKLEPGTDGEVG
jgi:hypothetical protein